MATLAQHELNARSTCNDALLLNSGLFGTHARSSSFSTHLAGRFYKNSTLAAHAARKKRAARMRAKKRELEQAIMLEERRAELLEERLRERKEQCLRIQRKRQEAALDMQCWVRQRRARHKVDNIRRYQTAKNQISVFCQARYRGFNGREVAHKRRREVAQQQRENEASIRIQCASRSWRARKVIEAKRNKLEKQQYAGACTIQACVRMRQCRRLYLERLREKRLFVLKRQHEACTKIQSIHRRNIARQEADRRRAAKRRAAEEKPDPKPKRVPLHMRRYSTYSVAPVASIASIGASKNRRRSSAIGLITHINTSKQQRRSSCPHVSLMATPEANTLEGVKSMGSTKGKQESVAKPPAPINAIERDKSKPNLVEEARQRAAARVHMAKRERKPRNPHDDERDKARTLRSRVASFEEKRRKLISNTSKKKRKKLSLGEVGEEGKQQGDGNDACAATETKERRPPQALSSEQSANSRSTCSPCTLESKERQAVHEHAKASLETESDAKFDSFFEHEDDLG